MLYKKYGAVTLKLGRMIKIGQTPAEVSRIRIRTYSTKQNDSSALMFLMHRANVPGSPSFKECYLTLQNEICCGGDLARNLFDFLLGRDYFWGVSAKKCAGEKSYVKAASAEKKLCKRGLGGEWRKNILKKIFFRKDFFNREN